MKKIIAFTLTIMILLCGFVGVKLGVDMDMVSAENAVRVEVLDEEGQKFSICITGEAVKSVSPDKATIYASVETLDMEMQKSKDDNFEVFDKILKALAEAGIEKEDVILEGFSSYPSYDYSCGKTLNGYRSTTSFSVAVGNIEDVTAIVDILTKNGTTSIRHINYEISNLEDVYQDVLMEALENAKEKAKIFTQRDDIKIVSVKEEQVYSCTSLYRDYGNTIQENAVIGKLDIKARVTVNFE